VWVVTPDDRLCPWCRDLGRKYGKQGTQLEERFVPVPQQRKDGSFKMLEPPLTPPAHPGCRCSMALVFT
jgi:hypothetical protein